MVCKTVIRGFDSLLRLQRKPLKCNVFYNLFLVRKMSVNAEKRVKMH